MSSLVEKQLQIAAPGFHSENVLWYGPEAVKVDDVEVNHLVSRTQISGNSSNLGSNCDFIIGSSEVCGYAVLTVTLTVPAATPNVCSGSGWLYTAISQLYWQFGSQSAAQPMIDGWAMCDFNHIVAAHKARDQHVWIGGEPINGPKILNGAVVPYRASVLVPLPQSSMLYGHHKLLPIDTGGLSSAFIVRMTFKSARDFLTGSDAPSISQWTSIVLNVETFELSQRNQSPYQMLRLNPQMSLDYPFSYIQGMTTWTQNNVAYNSPQILVLNGLLNADPLAIMFTVVPQMYAQQNFTNSSPLAYRSARCKAFEVRMNGQILEKVDNGLGAITEIAESGSALDRKIMWPNPWVDAVTGIQYVTAPCTFSSRRCPVYVWQASIKRAPAFEGNMMNTRRAPSTQITLTFTIDDDEPAGVPYYVRWVFIYNSIIAFQAGATTLIM